MENRTKQKLFTVFGLILFGPPASYIWWRFIYETLALGTSEGTQALCAAMATVGWCVTAVAMFAVGALVCDSK